mmetsp:Transcript_21716/g.39618  ORF Transcript_21716/g.39618 Transcript_21716/m.39618 type:complete len:88 (-) Transcript_21716:56-319(-)
MVSGAGAVTSAPKKQKRVSHRRGPSSTCRISGARVSANQDGCVRYMPAKGSKLSRLRDVAGDADPPPPALGCVCGGMVASAAANGST